MTKIEALCALKIGVSLEIFRLIEAALRALLPYKNDEDVIEVYPPLEDLLFERAKYIISNRFDTCDCGECQANLKIEFGKDEITDTYFPNLMPKIHTFIDGYKQAKDIEQEFTGL